MVLSLLRFMGKRPGKGTSDVWFSDPGGYRLL